MVSSWKGPTDVRDAVTECGVITLDPRRILEGPVRSEPHSRRQLVIATAPLGELLQRDG
jgi:hypothetical protein